MSLHSLPIADVLDPIVGFLCVFGAMNTPPLCEGCNKVSEIRCRWKEELQARKGAILDSLENL